MELFNQHLAQAREALAQSRSGASQPQAEAKLGSQFPAYALDPETTEILRYLQATVQLDIMRYRQPTPADEAPAPDSTPPTPAEQASPTAETPVDEAAPPAHNPPPPDPHKTLLELSKGVAKKRGQNPEGFRSLFYNLDVATPFYEESPQVEGLDPSLSEALGHHGRNLYRLLNTEVEDMAAHLVEQGLPVQSLQKMRKAVRLFAEGRVGDTLTVLRSTRNDDPHNRYLAFCHSQLLYYKAAQGSRESLPEAREEAKRTCSQSESFAPEKLLFYRYQHVVTELDFDKGKALEYMREYGLLEPSTTLPPDDALAAHQGLLLKVLIALSTTPAKDWEVDDIAHLFARLESTPGGGVLYVFFFRALILLLLQVSKSSFEPFRQVEETLFLLHDKFNRTVANLREKFNEKGLPVDGPAHMWTIPTRVLKIFLTGFPLPQFDEVLTNISLDCTHWTSTPKMDLTMRERGLHLESYWQAWAMKLTPRRDLAHDSIIPDTIVLRDSQILKNYDRLIEDLHYFEEQKLQPDRWQLATPYISPFTYEKLLELGTGRNLSPLQRGPDDPIYRSYYQAWSLNIPGDHLPSKLFEKRANAGAFWNAEEIQALFDGAERIIEDPVIGLEARQRLGFRKHLQINSTTPMAELERRKLRMNNHLSEFWWLYFILIPLSIMTFVVIAAANTYQNAFRMLFLLVLVFGTGGYIIYRMLIQGRKNPPAATPPRQTPPGGKKP